jgi:hypothetical protein
MFTVTIDDQWNEPLILIQPMDIPQGPRIQKDIDLGLYRLHTSPRHESLFISAQSVVRGALLIADSSVASCHEFFAFDLTDTDMFLRLKQIFYLNKP